MQKAHRAGEERGKMDKRLKRFLVSLAIGICTSGCASTRISVGTQDEPMALTSVQQSARAVVALMSKQYYMGHGCPVSPHVLLTADHMNVMTTPMGEVRQPLTWGDLDGHKGVAMPLDFTPFLDLAAMYSWTPFPASVEVAASLPSVGERVWVVNFDHTKRFSFLIDKVIPARIAGYRSYYIQYDKDTRGGSSGSCLLNDEGKVVGIHVAGNEVTNVGIGVMFPPGLVAQLETDAIERMAKE